MNQILVFNLSGQELGVDISCVYEVLKPQEIFPLPQIPEFIQGVINLRGHIVAVVDLARRFNLKDDKIKDVLDKKRRIIVCRVNPQGDFSVAASRFIVGFIVDNATDVITLKKGDIKPTPEIISMQIDSKVISGIVRIKERIIILLELGNIFTQQEVRQLLSS
ncbi:MAG: chemotaxis protein CheW [Candidatus Omnitrophota bacterium]